MYISTYPWELITQFVVIVVGIVINLIVAAVIVKAKAYQHLVVQLFICIMGSEMSHLLPQLIVPFFLYEYEPIDETMNQDLYPFIKETGISDFYRACKTQGYFLISSWLSSCYFCIYVIVVVWRILKGQNVQETEKLYRNAVIIALLIIIPAALITWLGDFQNYGFRSQGVYLQYLCYISIYETRAQFWRIFWVAILSSMNFTLILVMIFTTYKMCSMSRKFKKIGLSTDYPILGMRSFPIIMQILWNFNLLIKLLNYYITLSDNFYFSIFWVFLNSLINLEAVYLIGLFFHIYRDLLRQSLPAGIWRETARILSKLSFLSEKQQQIHEYSIYESDSLDFREQSVNTKEEFLKK